jgi:hypothetical protein
MFITQQLEGINISLLTHLQTHGNAVSGKGKRGTISTQP